MTSRLRTRVPEIFQQAQSYLHQRISSLETSARFESAKKPVKQWLEQHGEEDDDGNKVYVFPRAVTAVNDKRYSGVMLRKSVGHATMQADEVDALLKDRFTPDGEAASYRAFKTVRVLDEDEVYVLQQEGVITEDELRGLLHYPKPSYSLWPVEETVQLEDEDD